MTQDHELSCRPRVLIVEDVEVNRDLLQQLLEDRFDVRCAENGETGLELIRTWLPSVVLLDLSLPLLDGWTVAARVRADPSLDHVCIIALTAHAMAGDEERALAAGCHDYLTKPLDEDRLLGLIDYCTSRPAPR